MDRVKGCTNVVAVGTASTGRPEKAWQDSMSADWCLMDINPRETQDHVSWRRANGGKANLTESGNTTIK